MKRIRWILLLALVTAAPGCEEKPMLSVGIESLDFSESGGRETVQFVANKPWTAQCDATWCRVSPGAGGATNENDVTMTVTCDPNQFYDPRSCMITFSCEGLTDSVQVVQSEIFGLMVYAVDSYAMYSGGNVEFGVNSNVDYEVTVDAEAKDWLEILDIVSTKGLQKDFVILSVAENTTGVRRDGTIIFKNDEHGLLQTATVTQWANPVARCLNPEAALNLSGEGGVDWLDDLPPLELDFETNTNGFTVIVPDWMSASGGMIQQANDVFLYHAVINFNKNFSEESRTGEILLRTTDVNNLVFLRVPVSQQPRPEPLHITDAVLKDYVVAHYDTDWDGELSEKEALTVKAIYINTDGVESLDQLSLFPNLIALTCCGSESEDGTVNGKLKKLDVSGNPLLESLDCRRNQLTSIDLSNNKALRDLNVWHNQLKQIALSANAALSEFWCPNNPITRLDLSGNPVLKKLVCESTDISFLDISHCSMLDEIWLRDTPLTSLDLSGNAALRVLYAPDCQLKSLDLSGCPLLEELYLDNNPLTTVDVSKTPKLEILSLMDDGLSTIDVSNNPNLVELSCDNNRLTSLDVFRNTHLASLSCAGNQLTILDVSAIPDLGYLRCDGNANLREIWLRQDQAIEFFIFDASVSTVKYVQ